MHLGERCAVRDTVEENENWKIDADLMKAIKARKLFALAKFFTSFNLDLIER